jgi:hypothetical protein
MSGLNRDTMHRSDVVGNAERQRYRRWRADRLIFVLIVGKGSPPSRAPRGLDQGRRGERLAHLLGNREGLCVVIDMRAIAVNRTRSADALGTTGPSIR